MNISDLVSGKNLKTPIRYEQGSDRLPELWPSLEADRDFWVTWENKMFFVKRFGILMVQNAIQILSFIFPICIGKVT